MKRPIGKAQLALLSQAIDEADTWGGALPVEAWEEHDAKIRTMRAALRAAEATRAQLDATKAANKRLQKQLERLLK